MRCHHALLWLLSNPETCCCPASWPGPYVILHPAPFACDTSWWGQVDKVYYCAHIDKYISCARDGSFRLWQGADLAHVRTVNNGSSWITDCLYLPISRKMVFTTMDRAITYYDITR